MKRTLNTTINRLKSEKNDEHYTQLAANSATNTFTHNSLNQMVGRGVLDAPQTSVLTYADNYSPSLSTAAFHKTAHVFNSCVEDSRWAL